VRRGSGFGSSACGGVFGLAFFVILTILPFFHPAGMPLWPMLAERVKRRHRQP
jgi:hypothetical protein